LDGAHCTLALAFATTPASALQSARASLTEEFDRVRTQYEAGWHAMLQSCHVWVRSINANSTWPRWFENTRRQDLSWRDDRFAVNSLGRWTERERATISGYHAVWSRDLYEAATALDALGDRAGALRAQLSFHRPAKG
jgi:glucoamylase